MSAADFLPESLTLPALREAAAGCRGCHLWEVGTQTVFGEGAAHADAVTATVHPSSILRGEPSERETNFAAFGDDLTVVASLL